MSLLTKVKKKTSDILYRKLFYHLGYGRPDTKTDWEGAFSGGYWDFLEHKEEAGRYYAICNFVKQFKTNPRVLDVGCGKGVLYNYLKQAVPDLDYTGIDISETAVQAAAEKYPETTFRAMDFDTSTLEGRFDLIIFNETLEYFKRPAATLSKCKELNMLEGWCFIISMYQGHDGLWKHVHQHFRPIKEVDVKNENKQHWKVKLIQGEPLRQG